VIKEISAAGLLLLAAQAHALYKDQPIEKLVNKDYSSEQISKSEVNDVVKLASASCQAWMAAMPYYIDGALADNDVYAEIHRLEGVARGFQCN